MEYGDFSKVYDRLMYDYPYEDIFSYVENILQWKKRPPNRILEMACGTGSLTVLLKNVAPVTAFDLSFEMLSVAREKLGPTKRVRLYREDMRKFSVSQRFDAILLLCDSLNYLSCPREVEETFSRVYRHLNPGGAFLFDVNTAEKYGKMGNQIFFDEQEGIFYVWENHFDPLLEKNYYRLHFFQEEEDGRYRRFNEEHVQQVFSREVLEKALVKGGFSQFSFYDGYSCSPADEKTVRLVCLAIKGE